ncbi:phosphoesterase [Apiospora aurea]|uniref:Phosphoesterase n=1 Tax=Apiospora aurea TaxID=335848 RepID=A0ABR1Q4Z3_9PEZI
MSEFESLLHRPDPSAWELIMMRGPCLLLAEGLYSCHRLLLCWLRETAATVRLFRLNGAEGEEQQKDPISVVCISDTHNNQIPIPDADILIHAGDLTQSGSLAELQAAAAWLRELPHRHKIVVAGSHDILLDPDCDYDQPTKLAADDLDGRARRRQRRDAERLQLDWGDVEYLRDRSTCISMKGRHGWRHLRVYGSPWSPRNGNWAFQYARADAKEAWHREVPDGTDILVTHGPPRGHLDLGGRLGCEGLLREVWRVRPALHVFGHIHEEHGQESVLFDAVQHAYEQTISEGGGFWNLCKLVWAFGASLFSSSPVAPECQMVNAAMVGGLRDQVWQRPIKVDI